MEGALQKVCASDVMTAAAPAAWERAVPTGGALFKCAYIGSALV